MYEVLTAKIHPTLRRLGIVLVRYCELEFYCDICIYKKEKLWIRMPEMWITPTKKQRFFNWTSQEESKRFQEYVLRKVFEMLGLDLKKGIEIKSKFFCDKKKLTKKKDKLNLGKKKIR